MIKVVLPKNDGVCVEIEGTDGKFFISYGKAAIRVQASEPDDKKRKGTIYEHRYAINNAATAAGEAIVLPANAGGASGGPGITNRDVQPPSVAPGNGTQATV